MFRWLRGLIKFSTGRFLWGHPGHLFAVWLMTLWHREVQLLTWSHTVDPDRVQIQVQVFRLLLCCSFHNVTTASCLLLEMTMANLRKVGDKKYLPFSQKLCCHWGFYGKYNGYIYIFLAFWTKKIVIRIENLWLYFFVWLFFYFIYDLHLHCSAHYIQAKVVDQASLQPVQGRLDFLAVCFLYIKTWI